MKNFQNPELSVPSAIEQSASVIYPFVAGVTTAGKVQKALFPLEPNGSAREIDALRTLYGRVTVGRYLSGDHGVHGNRVSTSFMASLSRHQLGLSELSVMVDFADITVPAKIIENEEYGETLSRALEGKLRLSTYYVSEGPRFITIGDASEEAPDTPGSRLGAAIVTIAVEEMQRAGLDAVDAVPLGN